MGEAELPPVQRRRCATERREWKKLVEIQQHLLLTSSRSSKLVSSSSSGGFDKVPQSQPPGPQKQPAAKTKQGYPSTKSPIKQNTSATQACSSAPALLGEQRILLHTAEVMETLSILLQSDSSACSSSSGAEAKQEPYSDLEKEHLKVLHGRMKSLMKQRCLLALKKECNRQVGFVRKLCDRTRELALAEDTLIGQLLSSGRPILPKDVLHLSFLQKAASSENLQAATLSWPWLLKFLGHTFNSFDAEWHGSLDVLLRWTHTRLNNLVRQLMHWAWLSLHNDILLLCHIDAGDLHADWIGGLFSSCHVFNQVLSARGLPQRIKPFPVSAVLYTLAARQAKFSVDKLASFICAEVKRAAEDCRETPDTAKYWNVPVRREVPKAPALLAALVQCGQSLLLKYLFAATCLNHVVPPQETEQKQGIYRTFA